MKRAVPLALAVLLTAGFGRKAHDCWRGIPYVTIWRQERSLDMRPLLPLPSDRSKLDLNDDSVPGSGWDIRRTYPGLLGCSGTELNDCTFLLVTSTGRVLEVDTIGEHARDLTVWSHRWISADEADREIRHRCSVPPWASYSCPR